MPPEKILRYLAGAIVMIAFVLFLVVAFFPGLDSD
jgi:hypothetical protein